MRMNTLLASQRILLVNWIVGPGFAVLVGYKSGVASAVGFIIIWLIADKAWDWLTGVLIAIAGQKPSGDEESAAALYGDIPPRVGLLMVTDLLGTLLLPWIIAGILLV